jgi:hypothetical protein
VCCQFQVLEGWRWSVTMCVFVLWVQGTISVCETCGLLYFYYVVAYVPCGWLPSTGSCALLQAAGDVRATDPSIHNAADAPMEPPLKILSVHGVACFTSWPYSGLRLAGSRYNYGSARCSSMARLASQLQYSLPLTTQAPPCLTFETHEDNTHWGANFGDSEVRREPTMQTKLAAPLRGRTVASGPNAKIRSASQRLGIAMPTSRSSRWIDEPSGVLSPRRARPRN